MSLLLLILLIEGRLASTTRLQKVYYDPDEAEVHFEEFVRTFGRHYADDDEKQMRLEIFRENLKEINSLNEEDQHATFGAVEGQYAIKHANLTSFSAQQILDCRPIIRCNTGWVNDAYYVIIGIGGLMSEEDYPFTGRVEGCHYSVVWSKLTVTHCTLYGADTDDALKQILYSTGPITAVMEATTLLQYARGILSKPCSGDTNNLQSVLIVGYGTENGVPYWIAKNSWGEKWGEKGFFIFIRGKNYCSVLNWELSIPQIA